MKKYSALVCVFAFALCASLFPSCGDDEDEVVSVAGVWKCQIEKPADEEEYVSSSYIWFKPNCEFVEVDLLEYVWKGKNYTDTLVSTAGEWSVNGDSLTLSVTFDETETNKGKFSVENNKLTFYYYDEERDEDDFIVMERSSESEISKFLNR